MEAKGTLKKGLTTTLFSATCLALLIFAGCEENPVEEYGTGLVNAYKQSQPAADSASITLLQQSAQAFRAAKGRYPQDLAELEAFTGTRIPPEKFSYDTSSGQVSLKQD